MKKLVIADILSVNNNGKLEGHYLTVAQNYIDMFEDEYEIYVSGGPIYNDKFSKIISLPYDTIPQKSKILNKLRVLCNFFEVLRKSKNAIIVFQCSAVSTIMIGLLLKRPKNQVYIIQYDCQMISSKIKKRIFTKIKKRVRGIICPGEEIGDKLGLPYCIVPDYIFYGKVSSYSNIICDIDFGIYGILAQGKGILEVAKKIANMPYKLQIAGKVGSLPEDKRMITELQKIAETAQNISLKIGYLDNEEYLSQIRRTKYCVLNYDKSYALRSSGVIFDSLFNCRPVLVKNRTYAEFVKNENIGVVYDEWDEIDIDKIIRPDYYLKLQNNIVQYLEKQQRYKNILASFLQNTRRNI